MVRALPAVGALELKLIITVEPADVVLADLSRSNESDQRGIVGAVRDHADPNGSRVPVGVVPGASP